VDTPSRERLDVVPVDSFLRKIPIAYPTPIVAVLKHALVLRRRDDVCFNSGFYCPSSYLATPRLFPAILKKLRVINPPSLDVLVPPICVSKMPSAQHGLRPLRIVQVVQASPGNLLRWIFGVSLTDPPVSAVLTQIFQPV